MRFLMCVGLVAGITSCASPSDSTGAPTYCDVEPIFEASCQRCHGSPLRHDAPFPLTSYEEIYAERAMVRRAVQSGFMPYTGSSISPPVQELSSSEQDLIVEWVDAGAPNCD